MGEEGSKKEWAEGMRIVSGGEIAASDSFWVEDDGNDKEGLRMSSSAAFPASVDQLTGRWGPLDLICPSECDSRHQSDSAPATTRIIEGVNQLRVHT